ncbi:MAG: hypothetical protein ACI4MN_00925 [Candidatus Coproplasma sp.]
MDKLRFMRLWDLYGGLLTATQREITDMYFNLDLTISEIAEQKGISRQGVSDCLNICKKELAGFEEKLGHDKLIANGADGAVRAVENANLWADEFLRLHPEYAADIAALRAVLKGEEVL